MNEIYVRNAGKVVLNERVFPNNVAHKATCFLINRAENSRTAAGAVGYMAPAFVTALAGAVISGLQMPFDAFKEGIKN